MLPYTFFPFTFLLFYFFAFLLFSLFCFFALFTFLLFCFFTFYFFTFLLFVLFTSPRVRDWAACPSSLHFFSKWKSEKRKPGPEQRKGNAIILKGRNSRPNQNGLRNPCADTQEQKNCGCDHGNCRSSFPRHYQNTFLEGGPVKTDDLFGGEVGKQQWSAMVTPVKLLPPKK